MSEIIRGEKPTEGEEVDIRRMKRRIRQRVYVAENREYVLSYLREYRRKVDGESEEERLKRLQKSKKPPPTEEQKESSKKLSEERARLRRERRNKKRREEYREAKDEPKPRKKRIYSESQNQKIQSDPVKRKAKNLCSKKWYDNLLPEAKLELKQKRATYKRECLKDPIQRVLHVFRSRAIKLFSKLDRANVSSGDSFDKYFSCAPETLKAHIESLFKGEMSWENRGKLWHLDHIVPLFLGFGDFATYKKLNHYKNLQPLLIAENLSKGDSIPEIWPEGVPFTREEIIASHKRHVSEKSKVSPKVTKKTKTVSVSQEM